MPEFNEFFESGDEEKISALAESNDDLTRETQRVLAETVSELNILRQQFELERTDNATKGLIKQSVQYKLQRLYARADARRVIAEMLEFSPDEIEGFNEKYLEFQEIVSSINSYLQSASAVFSPNFLSDYPVFSLRFTEFVSSLDDDVKNEIIAVSESDSAYNDLSSNSQGAKFSFNEVCELKSVYDSVNALNNLQASNTEASFRSQFDNFKESFQSVAIGSEHSELFLYRVSLLSSHFATLAFNQGDRQRLITYLRSNNIRVDINNLDLNYFTSLYEQEERPNVKPILNQFIISLLNFQKDFNEEFLVPISLQANLELQLAQKIADGDLESADTLLFMTRRTFPDLDINSLSSNLRSIDNTRLMELIHADSQDFMHELNRFTSNVDRESNQKILDLLNLMVIRNDNVNSLKEAYFCLKDIYSSNRLDELAIRGYFNMHQVDVYDTIVDLRNLRRYFVSDSSLFFMYFEQNVNRVDSIDTFNTDLYESLKLEQRHNLARSYIEGFLHREYGKVFSSLIENDSQLKADYESYKDSLSQEFCTSKNINSNTVMTESLFREYSIFFKYSLRNYVTNVVRNYLIDNRDNIRNIPNGRQLLELFDLANEDFNYEESLFNFTSENWNYFSEGLKRSLILAPAIMPLVAPSASVVTVGEVASIAPVAASAVSTSSGVFSFSKLGLGGISLGVSALVHLGVLGSAHEYADRRRRFEITTLTSQPAHFITMTELESHQEFEYEEVLNGFKESENKSEYLMGLNFALRADIISSLPSNEISGLESQVLTEYFSVMNNLDDTLKSQAHSQIRTLADNAMHLNVTLSKLNHQSAQNVAEVIKQDPNFAERSYLNLTKHVLGISDQVNLDEQLSYFETQLPDFESYMQDKDVFANYVRRLNVEMDRDKLPLVFLISEFHKNRESQMDRNRRGLVSVPAEQTFAQALLGFRTRLEQVQGDLESDSTRQIESIVRQWGNYNITNRSTLDLLAGDGGLCENRAIMSYLLARTVSPDKPLRMMHTDQLDPSTQDFVRHVELIQPYTITYEDGETFSSHRAYAPNVKLYKDADVLEFSTNADENILNGVQEYLGLRDREQAQRSVDGDFVDTLPDINGYGPVLSSTGYLVQDAPNIRAQQESANNTLLDSDPTNVIGSIAYQNRIRNFNKAFEDVTDPLKSRHRDLLEQVFLKSNMTIQRLNTYLESDGGELYVETLSDDLIDLLAQQPPNVVNSLFRFSRLTRYMSFDPNRFRKLVDLGLRFNDEVVNPVTVTGDSNLVNVELNIKFCYERFGSRVLLNFQDERQLNLRFLQRIKDKVILNNLTRSIFDARADLDGLHIMEAGYGDQSISSNVKFVSEFFVNSESNISRENLRDDLNVSKLVLDERSNLTSMPVQEFLVQQTRQEISLRTHNTRLLRYILDEGQALNVSLRTEPEHVNENLSILESYYSNTAEQRRALSQVSLPDSLDSLIESPVPVRQIDEQVEMQDIASLRAADRRLNKNVKISLYFMSVADFRNVLPRLQQLVQASEFKLRFEVEINNLNSESDETYQATLREISSARNINLHEDT